jgi:hypothetical protein
MSGWIKLHRSLKDWEWYDDHNTTRLLIHLLLTVNIKDKKWKGITVKAGSRVTSFSKLAQETGLSVKQIRNSLLKLENSKEVARQRANEGQAITLIKWAKLQCDSEKGASDRADEGQTEGKQGATTKEYKELEERKKILVDGWITYRKQLKKPLTESGLQTLCKRIQKEPFEVCKLVLDNSMENGWQGLFWDNVSAPQIMQRPSLDRLAAHTSLDMPDRLQSLIDKGWTREEIELVAQGKHTGK